MTAPKIEHVLVAGPNGSLGQVIVSNLLKNNFTVSLLTRNVAKTKESFPECTVVEANYDSVEQLAKTIKENVDAPQALVSLLNRDQTDAQIMLIDAAVAAGIYHVVPSCFGIGTGQPGMRQIPIWETKVRMEDYVLKRANEGAITYTGLQSGAFLDWALEKGVYLNCKGGPTPVFDGGDVPFSATLMDDVGKAVAAALRKPEVFGNRFVYIHSAVVTQNLLLKCARELDPSKELITIPLDTADLEQRARERWDAGDQSLEVVRMFMPRVTFGLRLGHFEHVDNEELGIEQMSDDQVKQLVSKYMKWKRLRFEITYAPPTPPSGTFDV